MSDPTGKHPETQTTTHGVHGVLARRRQAPDAHWFSPVRQSAAGVTLVILQYLADVCPNQDQQRELFVRCKIAKGWKGVAIMIKMRFIGKLALMFATGCLAVGMLGVDASAQTPRTLITVVIGDNHTFENMDLGVAAKLLVSDVCGVNERDAKEIVELAAKGNQKIVAICPGTGAVFHLIP